MTAEPLPGDGRRATFLVDAGPAAGAGHLARCRTLADGLADRGWQTLMARPASAQAFGAQFTGTHHTVDLEEFLTPERERGDRVRWRGDLLVVDHYGLDWATESQFRSVAGRIMVLDDLANRGHDCDLLLDQTFGRDAAEYRDLVPDGTTVLTGSEYALLRPEFAALRGASLGRTRRVVGRVLISLGGSAAQSHSAALARATAAALPGAQVIVAMTPAAPGIDELRRLVADSANQVRLLDAPGLLGCELAAADLAIGAAGTSAWERCCLGVPSLVMVMAENQAGVAAALEGAGAARRIDPGVTGGQLREIVTALDLAGMSAAAARVCDGGGAARVIEHIEASVQRSQVALRAAAPSDSRFIWETNNTPDVRRVSHAAADISWDEHTAWFARHLDDPDSRIFLAEAGGAARGVIRFRREGSTATISIALTAASRGRGLGAEAIRRGCRLARAAWPIERVVATIQPENVASRQAFRHAGFVEAGPAPDGVVRCEERWPPFSGPKS